MTETIPEVESADLAEEEEQDGQRIRHDFEDADTGDEVTLELGVSYAIITSFVELSDEEVVVFTHRVREAV